jgi:hypothetical protein
MQLSSSFLGPNILLSTLSSNILKLWPSLKIKETKFHTDKLLPNYHVDTLQYFYT